MKSFTGRELHAVAERFAIVGRVTRYSEHVPCADLVRRYGRHSPRMARPEQLRPDHIAGCAAAVDCVTALWGDPDATPITQTGEQPQPLVSISHSAGVAVAVATRHSGVAGVGLDIELTTAPESGLHLIATAVERERLRAAPQLEMTQVFAAKESLFKAFAKLGAQPRGLRDVQVDVTANRVVRGWLSRNPSRTALVRTMPVGSGWMSLCIVPKTDGHSAIAMERSS